MGDVVVIHPKVREIPRKEGASPCTLMLVTANVGTLFEQPDDLISKWVDAFVNSVLAAKADFVALHIQELGGKDYRKGMSLVRAFFDLLRARKEIRNRFNASFCVLDTNYDSSSFTALGNFYFISNRADIKIFDFKARTYSPVAGAKYFDSQSMPDTHCYRREKFPSHFYPQVEWTRKGYCQTRWLIDSHEIDLVNMHLFHDASNIVATQAEPSVYAINRRRAMNYVVSSVAKDVGSEGIVFFFGDMNFRLSHQRVLKHFASRSGGKTTKVEGDTLKEISLADSKSSEEPLLVLKDKKFLVKTPSDFLKERGSVFRAFDIEGEVLHPSLREFPVVFEPSYPYSEDPDVHDQFLTKRCPGWCDRVLMTPGAMHLVVPASNDAYDLIGRNVCMGDHKPVKLVVQF